MFRLEVTPSQLSGAGGHQHGSAAQVAEVGSRMAVTASQAAGAAGDPALAAALEGCAQSWGYGLEALAQSIDALAGNLEGAAATYEATDRGAMPGGR
jgi:Excreted virulence factor EspC, type VII ESX diderm